MTIPHAVILTSIAWAIIATALVAIEKWSARRHYDVGFGTWAEHMADATERIERISQRADGAEHRMHTAEIALRHYRQGVEAGVSHSVNTLNAARIAARAGEPYGGSQHAPKDGLRQDVPGSWKA